MTIERFIISLHKKPFFPFFYCLFLHFVSVLISRFREADVEKSLLLLQILIDQSKDEQLLRLYVEKIKCLLKKSQLEDVLSSINDLCCLLDRAKEFKKSWQHSYHNFDSDLFTVLSELQTKNAWKTTIMLVRCLLQVSILYYDGQKLYKRLQLLMLKVTSFPNKIIIEKSNSLGIITNRKFNDKFQVLEEIIQAAHEISEVSSVSKAIHLAFMMHRLGEEQEKVHDYVNSSASYAKAINLVETEQNYIARISPQGESFHNLGRVLERRKKPAEAKLQYEKSLRFYEAQFFYHTDKINSIKKDLERIQKTTETNRHGKLRHPIIMAFLLIVFVLYVSGTVFAIQNKYWLRNISIATIDSIILNLTDLKNFIGANIKPTIFDDSDSTFDDEGFYYLAFDFHFD